MKVSLTIKAEKLQSSASIHLTLNPALYWIAKAKIHALSEELNKLNEEYEQENAREV